MFILATRKTATPLDFPRCHAASFGVASLEWQKTKTINAHESNCSVSTGSSSTSFHSAQDVTLISLQMGLLHEKVVVITGSSGGIGCGCAFECAAQGAKIVLHHLGTSQTEQDAKALQDRLRNRFLTTSIVYGADLTDDEGPQKLIDAAVSRLAHIDVLVNNAAIFKPLPADQETKSVVANNAKVNFVALYLVTQAATRHMVERGKSGSIVTICNTAVVGTSNAAHYAGSKAAGLALM
jgi:L-rhamnose 1-dehydrogenase